MTRDELLAHITGLLNRSENQELYLMYPQITEFLRKYAGGNTLFFVSALQCDPRTSSNHENEMRRLIMILNSFYGYVEAGFRDDISPERQALLDVVNDFLEMAETLLTKTDVHPAAPTVLIGATLEEFLRTWIQNDNLLLGDRKPGLETYSQILREADKLSKQDGKDITSWAGIRNHAAHGEWDEVSDKKRVRIMLEGVNLFMRKYSN